MSLTLPANYTGALTSPFKENWLFQLYHGDESAFVGLSFLDTTVSSIFYTGLILNQPQIRESIDLERSTSKSSNISLEVANTNFRNDDFSAEIFGTSRYFINHTVKVYSQLNDASSLSDCLQIYEGRLISVSHSDERVRLEIVSQRPWDFITIPQDKTTTGNYIPVVYGDYTINSAGNFASNKNLFPVPQNEVAGGRVYYVAPRSLAGSSNNEATPHYYEKGVDQFQPIASSSSATVSEDGGNLTYFPSLMERSIKFRPIRVRSDNEWTDPTNAFDGTSNAATYRHNANTGSGYKYLYLEFPNITGIASAFTIYVSAVADIDAEGNPPTEYVDILNYVYDTNDRIAKQTDDEGVTTVADYSNNTLSDYQTAGNRLPDTWAIRAIFQGQSGGGTFDGTAKILDTWATMTVDLSDPDTTSAQKSALSLTEFLQDLEYVYLGCDGLGDYNLYSNDSDLTNPTYWINDNTSQTTITKINQAHLDLLYRFTNYVEQGIEGWSALNAARSSWTLRYWTKETDNLLSILERLQYEGGFIFRWRADGTGHYIHIPNSPSTDFTLSQDDMQNIQVSHTSFENVITKTEMFYAKHPAEDRYLSTQTCEKAAGTTPRSKWNIQSKENIKEINLDMLVAGVGSTALDGDRNDGFSDYYDAIYGDIKTKISAVIVNPRFYGIEPGDFLAFSDMVVDPFGESWSGKQFIVTSLNRRPGMINFTAKEV